jgi:hypothetical protein
MGTSSGKRRGQSARRFGCSHEVVDPDFLVVDVRSLPCPLDGAGLIVSGETEVSLLFCPSERPSGAWMLGTFEAGPLRARRREPGPWRLGLPQVGAVPLIAMSRAGGLSSNGAVGLSWAI